MKYFYDGQTYYLKTRVDMLMRMDVVPVEYGTFAQTFHLVIWLLRFITGINFKCDYMLCRIIALLTWIGLCNILKIYKTCPQTHSYGLVEVLDLYGEHSF